MAFGGGPLPSSGASELERIRSTVAAHFPVYETRVGPQSLLLAIHADRSTLEASFDRLRQELGKDGYVPILKRESGEEFVEVIRRPRLAPRRPWINLALLAGTFSTTIVAGALIWLTYSGRLELTVSDVGFGALYFALPVLTILGVHEFAHYAMARRRHLDASLPYFIPVPPPFLFGTFGAFVSIREPFPDRKALFDVGASGPIAGFAASVPIALVGMLLSAHAPVLPGNYCGPTFLGQSYGSLVLGSPLFWNLLSLFVPLSFANLHPLAIAGWVGVLVTAVNLLPAGSLDGGHVFRALLGERARYVSYGAAILLFGLGLVYSGWLLFAILVLFLGLRHPPPLNDLTRLDAKRYGVGALVAGVLVVGFVLVPISVPPGSTAFLNPAVTYPAHHPPGAMVAANFSAAVENRDGVAHAFLFSVRVENVTVNGSGGAVPLTGAALTGWERNASWTFHLPDGTVTGTVTGGTVEVPSSQYTTLNGSSQGTVTVVFSDTDTAVGLVVRLSTWELCATVSGGSAETVFFASFP